MHYYQFNIGDYTAHTARLSPMEDLIYRRLLDLYYLNEHPFNECSKSVAREIGLVEFSLDVEFILGKFFYLEDGFWKQNRAEREIAKYHSNKKSASKAGKASAKARKLRASERTLNDCTQSVEPNIKHKPLNNKQEPLNNKVIKKSTAFIKPTPDEVNEYASCNKLNLDGFFDYYTSNGWKVNKNAMKDWKASCRNWSRRQSSFSNQQKKPTFSDQSTEWAVEALSNNCGIMGFDDL